MISVIHDHYNKISSNSEKNRNDSCIINIRNFNNLIKSILIGETSSRLNIGFSVLDLAGGKGGDLKKFRYYGVGYLVLVDISEDSVKLAEERYLDCQIDFPCRFMVEDCFSSSFLENLGKERLFDVVSCQFALQYAFESQARAETAFHNISESLRIGGYFIGTIPDYEKIVSYQSKNSKCKISLEKNSKSWYGNTYYFTLDKSVKNCPEWLVPTNALKTLGIRHGLKLLILEGFIEYFERFKNHHHYRKLVNPIKNTMADEDWEIVNLYKVFVFRKL